MPVIVLIAGVSLLLVFMTELISNTAATAAFLPVAGSLVIGGDAPPVLLVVTIALAASCGFMLPVGTVPNALVFGTGYIPLPKMVRAGFILDLLAAAVITAGIALAAFLFGAGDARAQESGAQARHIDPQRCSPTEASLTLSSPSRRLSFHSIMVNLALDASREERMARPARSTGGRGATPCPLDRLRLALDSHP
jgi:Na+/H+ antiporter NhaD/arsenite permease-like protein